MTTALSRPSPLVQGTGEADVDLRVEVHDASRLEWTVAVPLPDTRLMPASSVHLQMALLLATLADGRVARPDGVTPHWL